jgi:hypothetical protein
METGTWRYLEGVRRDEATPPDLIREGHFTVHIDPKPEKL